MRPGWYILVVVFAFAVGTVCQTPSPSPTAGLQKERVKRWFEFEQLSTGARYHFIESEDKRKLANNLQYQFVAKFRFKFDPKGKYSVAANLATGPVFTTLWNSTGWGTGKTQRNIHFRQLFFDAKPSKAIEVQVGGLYINYGENTEALTYDNDGYIVGERVQVRRPKKMYFDEVSVTYGRLADVTIPNVFNRFKRFDRQNYHQFLVRKQVNKFVRFSADYTFESGRDTLHQAVRFKLPKDKILDTFLFENYERVDPDRDYGYNIFGEKKLSRIFTVSGGFVDTNIPALNSDRFLPGKRAYFNAAARLSREFSLTTQFTQGVGFIAPSLPRTRVDIILNYNLLETLRRTRFF